MFAIAYADGVVRSMKPVAKPSTHGGIINVGNHPDMGSQTIHDSVVVAGARHLLQAEVFRVNSQQEVRAMFWVCECGRKLYEHSRFKEPGSGNWIYICAGTESGRFKPSDGRDWPPKGV